MNQPTHTPGPWAVFEGTCCVYSKALERGAGIAHCGMAARTAEEQDANAQLVAAAPELLEALQSLCRKMDAAFGALPPEHEILVKMGKGVAA